jgi:hypothetical protein
VNRETLKTLAAAGAAVALAIAAAWVEPEARRPEIFSDQGESLTPGFRDVNAVQAIEVIEFNPADAVARPLKVELRKGRWVLSSHYDYPAQSGDRLAKTAASLFGLKKDIVVSERVEDHAQYGVIDPLDPKVASLQGRGKRVTLRQAGGSVAADLILGYPVKERPGYRYARQPGGKRVYAVKTDADPSARFEDWAEPSLLRLNPSQIRVLTVLSYSIDERMGGLSNVERTTLRKEGDTWRVEGGGRPKQPALQSLLNALASLKVAGVRPKPPELAAQLKSPGGLELSLTSMLSLRQRGFFLTPQGRILANEGELLVDAGNGVTYTLRFGEIVTGQGEGEGKPAAVDPAKAAGESRFLWITAGYDAARAARYGDTSGAGESIANAQRSKFADWYYVISGPDFQRLRPKRTSLVE